MITGWLLYLLLIGNSNQTQVVKEAFTTEAGCQAAKTTLTAIFSTAGINVTGVCIPEVH